MLAEDTPLMRLGKPHEVAQAALFLAQSRFITGQALCVDGGFCALNLESALFLAGAGGRASLRSLPEAYRQTLVMILYPL